MSHSETTDLASDGREGKQTIGRRSLAIYVLRLLIQLYRHTLSPAQVFLFGAEAGCRFTPTCSQYAMEAIQRHGAMAGSVLACKRICRCHPLGECGHDPVPPKMEGQAV